MQAMPLETLYLLMQVQAKHTPAEVGVHQRPVGRLTLRLAGSLPAQPAALVTIAPPASFVVDVPLVGTGARAALDEVLKRPHDLP